MAIAFDTAAGGWTTGIDISGTSNTTVAANVPGNTEDGDVLLGICASINSNNPGTITLPAGFTSIAANDHRNGTFCVSTELAWRQASNEPASHTWGVTASGQDDMVGLFRITGADVGGVIDGTTPSVTDGYGTSPVCPSVTTTVADALAVFVITARQANVLAAEDSNYPSGTTGIMLRRSRNLSNGVALGVAVKAMPTPGATGTQTWTNALTANKYWSAATFAFAPAAAGGDPNECAIAQTMPGVCTNAVTAAQTITEASECAIAQTMPGVCVTAATAEVITTPARRLRVYALWLELPDVGQVAEIAQTMPGVCTNAVVADHVGATECVITQTMPGVCVNALAADNTFVGAVITQTMPGVCTNALTATVGVAPSLRVSQVWRAPAVDREWRGPRGRI